MVTFVGRIYNITIVFATFLAFARSNPIISSKSARQLANAGGQVLQAVMENDHWKTVEDIKHKLVGVGTKEAPKISIRPSSYNKLPQQLNSLKSSTGKVLQSAHVH
jgi:hypothetical protein